MELSQKKSNTSYKPILIKCIFTVPTVQRPAENKTSFLRHMQFECMMFLHSHRRLSSLLQREGGISDDLLWDNLSHLHPSVLHGAFLVSFSVPLSLSFCIFSSNQVQWGLSFLTGRCSLLGLPCSDCLQARWCSSPRWLMNAYLPPLPFHFFLIMSILFGGLGHHLVSSEHSLMFSVITKILTRSNS